MVQIGGDDDDGGPFATLVPEALQRQLEITLTTAFHLTQAVLPEMVARRYGRVLMVSSVTGPLVTAPGSAAYAAAKGALDGLMRTISIEHGRDGITDSGAVHEWVAATPMNTASSELSRYVCPSKVGYGLPSTT
jgi:3-oxoacyl-[acyl-carrier protein] reductase